MGFVQRRQFYSSFTNTFGLEKILIAVSISWSFFSRYSFRCLTRKVSLLTGRDCSSLSMSSCAVKRVNRLMLWYAVYEGCRASTALLSILNKRIYLQLFYL